MSYKLTNTKSMPNPDYAEQLKEYERSKNYGYGAAIFPSQQNQERVLEVEVTDEMFSAIRRACLEAM